MDKINAVLINLGLPDNAENREKVARALSVSPSSILELIPQDASGPDLLAAAQQIGNLLEGESEIAPLVDGGRTLTIIARRASGKPEHSAIHAIYDSVVGRAAKILGLDPTPLRS